MLSASIVRENNHYLMVGVDAMEDPKQRASPVIDHQLTSPGMYLSMSDW